MKRFPDNARVCFIGDSITHVNHYLANIVAFYRENFPKSNVEFYNCGISGGTLSSALNSFDEDIAIYNPTHAVIMIGINDSNREALSGKSEEKYNILKTAYENYKINLEKVCARLKNTGVIITLCTPTPYAEYVDSNVPALRGGSALLVGYADFVRNYAMQNGYPLCDYHSYITKVMQTENIYDEDHVHPTLRGHYYIAKCFLEFQGLELGEEKELPADIARWHETVVNIRDTIATEYFVLFGNFSNTPEQRMAAVVDYLENGNGYMGEYITNLAKRYFENKSNQQTNIQYAIDFMRNK